jgi:hypothetical protein
MFGFTALTNDTRRCVNGTCEQIIIIVMPFTSFKFIRDIPSSHCGRRTLHIYKTEVFIALYLRT